jgi:regulator of sigma E protease
MFAGVAKTWAVATETVLSIIQMVTTGKAIDEFGGPLRIAQLSGQAASLGLDSVLLFISVLSINLGIINLFPIPLLDGGHLLICALEALRGRALPEHVQEYGFRVGIVVLVTLLVLATWNDLVQIGLVGWIVRSVSF